MKKNICRYTHNDYQSLFTSALANHFDDVYYDPALSDSVEYETGVRALAYTASEYNISIFVTEEKTFGIFVESAIMRYAFSSFLEKYIDVMNGLIDDANYSEEYCYIAIIMLCAFISDVENSDAHELIMRIA